MSARTYLTNRVLRESAKLELDVYARAVGAGRRSVGGVVFQILRDMTTLTIPVSNRNLNSRSPLQRTTQHFCAESIAFMEANHVLTIWSICTPYDSHTVGPFGTRCTYVQPVNQSTLERYRSQLYFYTYQRPRPRFARCNIYAQAPNRHDRLSTT